MKVVFDVAHLYYLPQYLPIYKILKAKGVECVFVIYKDENLAQIIAREISKLNITHVYADSDSEALNYYNNANADWIVFGNKFNYLEDISESSKTVFINHGAGVKSAGYSKERNQMDVRFIEGSHHFKELAKMYPEEKLILAGFSKLDPLINNQETPIDIASLGLDPNKPVILYAPTFYPSSIELFADNFPAEFSDYNIIVKLHFFSYVKSKYQNHIKKINRWKAFDNVYIAGVDDYSILPFLQRADLLISDASTALFEFAALNKPVVWCDFIKLRWTYKGPFRFRYLKRMDEKMIQYSDIAAHVKKYSGLLTEVDRQIKTPAMFEKKRLEYSEKLLGPLDGKASERIANYLLEGE